MSNSTTEQGLAGKVARFQSLSNRANKNFPEALAPIEPDIEVMRVEELDGARQGRLSDDGNE